MQYQITNSQLDAMFDTARNLGKYEGDGDIDYCDLCGVWCDLEPMYRMLYRIHKQIVRAGADISLEVWEAEVINDVLGIELADTYEDAYNDACVADSYM